MALHGSAACFNCCRHQLKWTSSPLNVEPGSLPHLRSCVVTTPFPGSGMRKNMSPLFQMARIFTLEKSNGPVNYGVTHLPWRILSNKSLTTGKGVEPHHAVKVVHSVSSKSMKNLWLMLKHTQKICTKGATPNTYILRPAKTTLRR
jgi:hypothetical protein